MHKKLMLACMAVAAFSAFVIAPAASAHTLTSEGTPVPVGTSITAYNTGVTKFAAGSFIVECDHVHLSGTVTRNDSTVIQGEMTTKDFDGTGANTDCTSPLGSVKSTVNSRLCVATVDATDNFNVTGCGANVTFTLNITGLGSCKYSTASVPGTFTTNATPVTATIAEAPALKEEGGFFCPNEGKLNMDFNLHTTGATTTSTGTGLTIS